jgi:hypothetical protein
LQQLKKNLLGRHGGGTYLLFKLLGRLRQEGKFEAQQDADSKIRKKVLSTGDLRL